MSTRDWLFFAALLLTLVSFFGAWHSWQRTAAAWRASAATWEEAAKNWRTAAENWRTAAENWERIAGLRQNVINVHGVADPREVARAVMKQFPRSTN